MENTRADSLKIKPDEFLGELSLCEIRIGEVGLRACSV